MIVAILFADRIAPLIDGQAPYFLPVGEDGEETLIEHVTSTVLRGPFGGTIVASASVHNAGIKKVLKGFAVQHVSLNASAKTPHANITAAIRAALDFRARWQKAMAAAAARFANTDDDEEDDEEPHKTKKPATTGKSSKKTDWAAHSKSPDVKIRGLARSFDRDGILFCRGERPVFKPDLQAQLVEAFGREGSDKKDAARPIAQAVFEGQRGYPILMSIEAAQEVAALPPETNFDHWLLQNLERVQDVKVADRAAVECIDSAEAYERTKAQS